MPLFRHFSVSAFAAPIIHQDQGRQEKIIGCLEGRRDPTSVSEPRRTTSMYFVLVSPWHSYAPENLRFRAGSICYLRSHGYKPAQQWLPTRAVKTPITLLLLERTDCHSGAWLFQIPRRFTVPPDPYENAFSGMKTTPSRMM